ncbi:hypothetical protein [Acrocarpospora sp. B8E8]|uniref:glycine-rich domain-containing protein n=1 Tax=Acrocarpospora sp. B8E8 TaxID=3153572 RepID=UPI00325F46A8
MTVAVLTPEQAELAARVDALDLEPIAYKLMHPEPGRVGVTLAQADQLIGAYRLFLKLCGWYPRESIVPSTAVDEAWHTHILDTAKYAQDCEEVFGYFLHHFPYLGLRGADDEALSRASSARSGELFRLHFGTDEGVGLMPVGGGPCDEGNGTQCTDHCRNAHSLAARPRPDRRPVLA